MWYVSLFQIIHPLNPSSCGKQGAGHKNVCISKAFSARLKRHCPRWWFQIFFNFHRYLGKIPILTNIFQVSWNHQPGSITNGFVF